MTASAKLGLEYLQNNAANQTLANLTFMTLNQLVQCVIVDKDLATPPGTPTDEAAYIVAGSPTGAWSGQAGKIAYWSSASGSWSFITPAKGWRASVLDELDANNVPRVYGHTGSAWSLPETGGGGGGSGNIPQNSKSANYTLILGDAGKHIFHPSSDTTGRTFTIPANSSVGFAVGDTVTFVNQVGAGTITISITSDTLTFAGTTSTGSRTLAPGGMATALKVTATEWMISGAGLS